MARGINCVHLVGFVGKDPEARDAGGTQVAKFSVGVSEMRGRGAEATEVTDWIRCACWRTLAEIASKYVKKGMMVAIEGKLRPSKYTDRDGNERETVEVEVRELSIPPRWRPEEERPAPTTNTGRTAAAPAAGEDIPY